MRFNEQQVFIRQSWLTTFHTCQERARFVVAQPELDTLSTDAAACGTIVHSGIETFLQTGSMVEAYNRARETFVELLDQGIKWTSEKQNPTSLLERSNRKLRLWHHEVWPHVQPGGQTELKFEFDTGLRPEGYELWFEGTIDYVAPSGVLWDWKTTSTLFRFQRHEKQRYSPQASIYTAAAVNLGLAEWPVQFVYGVVSAEKDAASIVEISRTRHDYEWVCEQAVDAVSVATRFGFDARWPRIDDHYLCSSKWCPWWDTCKGQLIP